MNSLTLPRIAVGSAPVEDSELLVDSLHSALNTKNASFARTAEMSLLCTAATGISHSAAEMPLIYPVSACGQFQGRLRSSGCGRQRVEFVRTAGFCNVKGCQSSEYACYRGESS